MNSDKPKIKGLVLRFSKISNLKYVNTEYANLFLSFHRLHASDPPPFATAKLFVFLFL